jgi:16S rRNA (adenine1518-N6/adenine1519-N6)-dimethyltransferase
MMKKRSAKRPGARLGQHFLTGTWAADKLVEAAGIGAGDVALEIGPGEGALTKRLLATGAHVVAVEKDPPLVEKLRKTFVSELERGQFVLLEEDVRSSEPKQLGLTDKGYVLAANIPYYITGEIIRQFLTTLVQPRTIAILIQKEVAERIVARDGKESILSISVKAYGTPSIIAKVSKGNFNPPPSVDSAILKIDGVSRNYFADISEEHFFKVVRAGFSSKRKKLASNLSIFGKQLVQTAFSECGLGENVRAEDVTLEEWGKLCRALA